MRSGVLTSIRSRQRSAVHWDIGLYLSGDRCQPRAHSTLVFWHWYYMIWKKMWVADFYWNTHTHTVTDWCPGHASLDKSESINASIKQFTLCPKRDRGNILSKHNRKAYKVLSNKDSAPAMYRNEARRLEFLVSISFKISEWNMTIHYVTRSWTFGPFWTALAHKFTTESPLIK